MKNSGQKLKLLFSLIAIFFLVGNFVYALQVDNYNMLEPIPYVSTDNKTANINTFIPGVVKLAIGIAGVLAVVVIIYGGIQYIVTDAFQGKSGAKQIISNAIWGLLLAIGAWLILNTINPDLVSFNLSVPQQNPTQFKATTTQDITTDGYTNWGDPNQEHEAIKSLNTKGVYVSPPNRCNYIGEQHCTSIMGLSPTIVTKLQEIHDKCKCGNVTITGGTEFWLHGNRKTDPNQNNTQHKPYNYFNDSTLGAIDLSYQNEGLNTYIRSTFKQTGQQTCIKGDFERRISPDNKVVYVYETATDGNSTGNHWHICYYK